MVDKEEVKEGNRWPTDAELANQERLETDNSDRVVNLQGGPGKVSKTETPYAVEDNETDDYVGVSPEYMTYANDTEKPMRAGGGVEQDLEDEILGQDRVVANLGSQDGVQTQGGGSMHETVHTAVSGRSYSSTVAKVTPDKAKVGDSTQPKRTPPRRPSVPASNQQ